MNARACWPTVSGSCAKLRSPITGLSGLLSTSTTGAKSRSNPQLRSSLASAAAKRAVSEGFRSPKTRMGGHSVQGARRRCTRPPSWSSATVRGASAGARSCRLRTRVRTSSGDPTFREKSTTPPTRPSRIRSAKSGGISVPGKPTNRSCPGCGSAMSRPRIARRVGVRS